MIIGELELSGIEHIWNEFRSQVGSTYNPAMIVEASRGSYQVATLALGSKITQQTVLEDFVHQPNVLVIAPIDNGLMTLEHIKLIQKHFSYKTDNNTPLLAIIPDATTLSLPVQNALLKTAEELQLPHCIIFGVQHTDQLLPTIQSRSQTITLKADDQQTAAEITDFWQAFLSADIAARKQLIEVQFSKKTKKGQRERDRLEEYIIALQKSTVIKMTDRIKMIEYFRKICHTVNSQMILDSFLFL